jgi:hypothetical protein
MLNLWSLVLTSSMVVMCLSRCACQVDFFVDVQLERALAMRSPRSARHAATRYDVYLSPSSLCGVVGRISNSSLPPTYICVSILFNPWHMPPTMFASRTVVAVVSDADK